MTVLRRCFWPFVGSYSLSASIGRGTVRSFLIHSLAESADEIVEGLSVDSWVSDSGSPLSCFLDSEFINSTSVIISTDYVQVGLRWYLWHSGRTEDSPPCLKTRTSTEFVA